MTRDISTVPVPLSIILAPTGMVPTRAHSPTVPLTPDEIINDVLRCATIGISAVHLHARDANDAPTLHKDVYMRIIGGIREKRPDLILCVSCSGRRGASAQKRLEVLDLPDDYKPDLASLTPSSMNFSSEVSVNAPKTVTALAEKMLERGIKPELEVFDLGMLNMVHVLIRRNLLQPPYCINLFFGSIASAQAGFLEIGTMVGKLPGQSHYSLAGIGEAQLPVAAMAAVAAPGVRIGLEDNLWLDPGRKHPATNVQLLERVHKMAGLLHRPIMPPAGLRTALNLTKH